MSESQKTRIIDFCKKKRTITSTDVSKLLGIATQKALPLLRKMAKEKTLKESKRGRRSYFSLPDSQKAITTLPISSQPEPKTSSPITANLTPSQTTPNLESQIAELSQRLNAIESLLQTLGLKRWSPLDPDQFRRVLLNEYHFLNPELDINGVELSTIRRRVARRLQITEDLFSDYLFDLQRKNANFRSRRGREKEYLAISPNAFD